MTIALTKGNWPITSPVDALSRGLDLLLIPVVCFVLLIKAYEIFDLYVFLIIITPVYLIKNLLVDRLAPETPTLNWLDLAVLFVGIVEVVSYATSTYQPNSLYYLVEALFLFLFYCLIRFNLRHDYQRVAIYLAIAATGFWISSRALYSFWRHYGRLNALGFGDASEFKHLFGLVGSDGYATAERITMLLAFLPFPLILFFKLKRLRRVRWLMLAPVATILLALSVTFSRAVYVAVFAFLLVASLLVYRYKLFSARRIILFNLLVGIVALVCLAPVAKPVLTTLEMFKSKSQVRSLEGRIHLWRASIDIVEQHPWTGAGACNFPMRYGGYTEEHTAFVVSTFNYFLQILAERGALGLLAYSLLLFAFFKTSADHIKLCKSELYRLTAILCVASFGVVIVRDLTYSSILINKAANAVLWLMFAAIARTEA